MTTDWYDDARLPKFSEPPVSEVAIGLEFPPLADMDAVKLVHLQNAWSTDYPNISEVPGSPPTDLSSGAGPVIQFGDAPRRIWAAQPESGLLLQTQNDRLFLNWRKLFSTAPYPGYESIGHEFSKRWEQFQASLAKMGMMVPTPHLGEFTYVNTVPLNPGETLADVLTLIADGPSEIPGTDTFGSFQFIREVSDQSAPFPAQIQVVGQPSQNPEGRVLLFNVTARVLLAGRPDAWLSGINAAHALASHTFAAIITEPKQTNWGRLR